MHAVILHLHLRPHVNGAEPESHEGSRQVDSQHLGLLKVGDNTESRRPQPTDAEREVVDEPEAAAELVGRAELRDLLVPDVDGDADQQSPDVDQLAEDAALRRSCTRVGNVREVELGVV